MEEPTAVPLGEMAERSEGTVERAAALAEMVGEASLVVAGRVLATLAEAARGAVAAWMVGVTAAVAVEEEEMAGVAEVEAMATWAGRVEETAP